VKPRTLIMIGIAASCGIIAVALWVNFSGQSKPSLASSARRSPTAVERVQAESPMATLPVAISYPPSPTPAKPTLRQRFRGAKDYAQLVKEIGPAAADGNAEAQYVTAEALRWCAQELKVRFIRPNGQVRTLDQVQARRAMQPAGLSQEELTTIYTRCQGFLENPQLLKNTGSWEQWLDKAVSVNYPAAMAEKARLLEGEIMLASVSQLPRDQQPHDQSAAVTEDEVRDLALRAVRSGDPDAIFDMSEWVRAGDRTTEEDATLISAWQMLACQKGYDCGPNSDFMKFRCDWDPQCSDRDSYVEYFQRHLGTEYDDALGLAKTIEQAIAANDVRAIRSLL
jgi:hypothetical protein